MVSYKSSLRRVESFTSSIDRVLAFSLKQPPAGNKANPALCCIPSKPSDSVSVCLPSDETPRNAFSLKDWSIFIQSAPCLLMSVVSLALWRTLTAAPRHQQHHSHPVPFQPGCHFPAPSSPSPASPPSAVTASPSISAARQPFPPAQKVSCVSLPALARNPVRKSVGRDSCRSSTSTQLGRGCRDRTVRKSEC